MLSKNQMQLGSLSLIWGNLRNYIDFSSVSIPTLIALTGTAIGEFPVDDYHPIFLEIPKNEYKLDLSGRSNNRYNSELDKTVWHSKRIISLPIYDINDDTVGNDSLEILTHSWSRSLVPEDIPFITLSVKVKGLYCDEREGQYVLVLLVWPDETARILELDWFEGPVEDCITPEWSIKSSYWLSLKEAITKLKNICSKPTGLHSSRFSIFVNPLCLGSILAGNKHEARWSSWKYEWDYGNHLKFIQDLNQILTTVEGIVIE